MERERDGADERTWTFTRVSGLRPERSASAIPPRRHLIKDNVLYTCFLKMQVVFEKKYFFSNFLQKYRSGILYYMALFPIKRDLWSGKMGKTFEKKFSLLPRTPSSFSKLFAAFRFLRCKNQNAILGKNIYKIHFYWANWTENCLTTNP